MLIEFVNAKSIAICINELIIA